MATFAQELKKEIQVLGSLSEQVYNANKNGQCFKADAFQQGGNVNIMYICMRGQEERRRERLSLDPLFSMIL